MITQQSVLSSVEAMPDWARLVVVAVCLCAAWVTEYRRPLFKLSYPSWWAHTRTNLSLLLAAIIIGLLFAKGVVSMIDWGRAHQFGLLYWLDLPVYVELLIALAILDLIAQYFAHVLLHKIRWMWRLHLVHHADNKVDVTTGTRLHPFDYTCREIFALLAIVLLGMPLAFYLLYRLITIFFTYFVHANIRLPKRLDRVLSWLFVTPDMHKFHHHHELPWTDSNYGGILSIWDRLFGTFVYDDTERIHYGINVLDDEKADKFLYQIIVPFEPGIKTNSEMQRQMSESKSV